MQNDCALTLIKSISLKFKIPKFLKFEILFNLFSTEFLLDLATNLKSLDLLKFIYAKNTRFNFKNVVKVFNGGFYDGFEILIKKTSKFPILWYCAGKLGNMNLIAEFLEQPYHHINRMLIGAYDANNINLIKFLVKFKNTEINSVLMKACLDGNYKIAKILIKGGANDFVNVFKELFAKECLEGLDFICKYLRYKDVEIFLADKLIKSLWVRSFQKKYYNLSSLLLEKEF